VIIEGLGEDRALRTLVNGKIAASLGRLHVPATTARVQFSNETSEGRADRALLDHRRSAAASRAACGCHGRKHTARVRAGVRPARAPDRARSRAGPRGAAAAQEILPREATARAGRVLAGAASASRYQPAARP